MVLENNPLRYPSIIHLRVSKFCPRVLDIVHCVDISFRIWILVVGFLISLLVLLYTHAPSPSCKFQFCTPYYLLPMHRFLAVGILTRFLHRLCCKLELLILVLRFMLL